MPVILWTDALLYLLLIALTAFVVYVLRTPHARGPWRRVFSSHVGMAALVILCAYLVVGVLDSIHYRPAVPGGKPGHTRYSPEVLSLLDRIVAPLREHSEQTYSAPFATRLYTRQVVTGPQGKKRQVYKRLKYGGANLTDPATQEAGDIARRALAGTGWGLLISAAAAGALILLLACRRRRPPAAAAADVLRDRTVVRWRTAIVTLAILVIFVCICTELAANYHIFGTDKVGEDVFYEALKSIRTGLLIGTLTTLVMLPFAIALGTMAGYFHGWVDDLVQYVYTTLSSIPGVLLIAAAILMLQVYMENHSGLYDTTAARADLRLLFLCLILGVTSWTSLCRLLRAETLKLSELDYVQAAVSLGTRHGRILRRHIVPNVMHIVLIVVVIDFSGLVLAEAVLSYVGVGVDPSMISWGNMINSARLELARDPVVWWPLAAAFVFMLVLVLAANLFADAVRDAFDPRLRGGSPGGVL